ncbi:MAG TPA: phosphomannomutase/phosphoglucomutase, partial [Marmoricola sp.]|nr:phosphomannomutase/phosphoglucomutase [Marmoricola sp.]
MANFSSDQLDAVFKAYDIRGTYDDQINEPLAWAIGNAFVVVTDADALVIGYDMRPSSPGLAAAFADGAATAGADVTLIGLASTDELYFASGLMERPGAMFTASHNPAQYNGIKLCRALAAPVGMETGLAEIKDLVARSEVKTHSLKGAITDVDVLDAYADFLLGLAPVAGRRLKVVVDAGNGMAGLTAPAVLGKLDLAVTEMYYELDGTFPNHEANPIEPANLVDLQDKVRETGADIGLAF